METQKIVNLLNDTDNEFSKFATKKWYVINDQSNTEYGKGNKNDSSIKFETKFIKSNLCDYSDVYILVTGDITASGGDEYTSAAFKNCAPFTRYVTHINHKHIDTAENLDIIIPFFNLIEYKDSFCGTSGSLWQLKRDEFNMNNARNSIHVSTRNSSSFKYKLSILGKPAYDGVLKNAKIVALKYLSNFWRSLEMPLVKWKIYLELNWTKNYVISDIAGYTAFNITNTKRYVPIVTLLTEDNVKLTKQFNE